MEPAEKAINHILIGIELMVWLGSLSKQSEYNDIFKDIQFSKSLIKFNSKPQLIWKCLNDQQREQVIAYYLYQVKTTHIINN